MSEPVPYHINQFLEAVEGPADEGAHDGVGLIGVGNLTYVHHGVVITPYDEDINIGVVIVPLLCLLQTLLVRLWRGCCAELPQAPSSRAASDGLPYSGELNDLEGRAGDYTEEQRLRDREEELRIKGRASRVTLSHV